MVGCIDVASNSLKGELFLLRIDPSELNVYSINREEMVKTGMRPK
jgi:hypothetical protein